MEGTSCDSCSSSAATPAKKLFDQMVEDARKTAAPEKHCCAQKDNFERLFHLLDGLAAQQKRLEEQQHNLDARVRRFEDDKAREFNAELERRTKLLHCAGIDAQEACGRSLADVGQIARGLYR